MADRGDGKSIVHLINGVDTTADSSGRNTVEPLSYKE